MTKTICMTQPICSPLKPLALSLRLTVAALFGLAGAAINPVAAQETIEKTITIYAAGTAGGGVDLYGRLVGRHIGKHIPGKPAVVVQDMPGAGGIRQANFLAETAPRDGTAFGIFAGGPILEPLVGARDPGYDMSKFTWIGALSKDVSLCIAWGATPFKSINDAKAQQMIVAGTGAGSDTDTYPIMLNELLGTKFKVITGYLGSQQTIVAIESGEVHGRCGWSLSSLKSTKLDWLRDKKINILLQIAMEKSKELPDIPLLLDLVSSAEDRQMLEMMLGTTGMSRPFVAPPGLPPARANLLRRAFDAMVKDPAFIAEAEAMQADLAPSTGEDVQKLVQKIYSTPKPVVDRAKKYLAPTP
jgi:tripartite-type tricarboxylate transporter receptor subunit TctC